jgi:hypothetical protein
MIAGSVRSLLRATVGLVFWITTSAASATDFDAAPNVSPGGDALHHPSAVPPGETTSLREGTHTGTFLSDLTGTPLDPIVVQLANEGVTSGCGSGACCPNDANTRGPMAAFSSGLFR